MTLDPEYSMKVYSHLVDTFRQSSLLSDAFQHYSLYAINSEMEKTEEEYDPSGITDAEKAVLESIKGYTLFNSINNMDYKVKRVSQRNFEDIDNAIKKMHPRRNEIEKAFLDIVNQVRNIGEYIRETERFETEEEQMALFAYYMITESPQYQVAIYNSLDILSMLYKECACGMKYSTLIKTDPGWIVSAIRQTIFTTSVLLDTDNQINQEHKPSETDDDMYALGFASSLHSAYISFVMNKVFKTSLWNLWGDFCGLQDIHNTIAKSVNINPSNVVFKARYPRFKITATSPDRKIDVGVFGIPNNSEIKIHIKIDTGATVYGQHIVTEKTFTGNDYSSVINEASEFIHKEAPSEEDMMNETANMEI